MTTLPKRVDIVVIGAGQAGLTMSWHLRQASRDHVIVERRGTLGGGWQDRWEQFRLVSPNWTAGFPDAPYDGDDPDGYMPRDEIAGRVARYAATIGAPVVLEAGVKRLRTRAGRFELETVQGSVLAREVVVATGGFHVPHVPAFGDGLTSRVLSLHAHHYRRAADLPAGAVLVVGSGQTGVQLVEELRAAGRDVFLCVGTAGRSPRRYRGRDIFFWLWQLAERGEALGAALPSVDRLPDPRRRLAANPHLSGHDGGHETDLRAMGRAGATLLGRLVAVDGELIRLAPDVGANLAAADGFFDERLRDTFDAFIEAAGLDCPPAEPRTVTAFEPPVVEELDLRKAGVGTILWTTGYRPDLRWIEFPIIDEMGFPRQVRGVTEVPGLFFVGSLWQHDQTSATLFGMPRDARVLAERMGLTSGSPSGS
jgi:putative flavoprotein involved in K+ transport